MMAGPSFIACTCAAWNRHDSHLRCIPHLLRRWHLLDLGLAYMACCWDNTRFTRTHTQTHIQNCWAVKTATQRRPDRWGRQKKKGCKGQQVHAVLSSSSACCSKPLTSYNCDDNLRLWGQNNWRFQENHNIGVKKALNQRYLLWITLFCCLICAIY